MNKITVFIIMSLVKRVQYWRGQTKSLIHALESKKPPVVDVVDKGTGEVYRVVQQERNVGSD